MLCHKYDTSPLIKCMCPIPERCCAQRRQQPALLQEAINYEAFLQTQDMHSTLEG